MTRIPQSDETPSPDDDIIEIDVDDDFIGEDDDYLDDPEEFEHDHPDFDSDEEDDLFEGPDPDAEDM